MQFQIKISDEARKVLNNLKKDASLSQHFKSVKKALRYLSINPRHPSLETHEILSLSIKFGCKVSEAYAENLTPGAYRIFWIYGPNKGQISILYITPHP